MSGAKLVGRLKAVLGLDRAEFSRGLNGAKSEMKSFETSLVGVGRSIKATLGLTVAGIGLQQVASQARQAVSAIAGIGDEAKRAGMSAKAFQEWKFVAEQNRIGIDAMVDGFKELSLRADEFVVTGGGSAAEAFSRLGFSAEDLRKKLKDPSELMLEIIGRMQKLDRAAQIRVSDELFGGSAGERFVELLDQGEAGLRRMVGRAHEVGAVLSSEMIAKADELDRKFNELSIRMENMFKLGVIGAADFIDQFSDSNSATLMELMGTLERAKAVMGDDLVSALLKSESAIGQNTENLTRLNNVTWEMVNAVDGLASAYIDAGDAAFAAGNKAAGDALVAASVAAEVLAEQFREGKIDADQLASGLLKVKTEADRVIASLAVVDSADLDNAVAEINRIAGAMATAAGIARTLVGWLAKASGATLPGSDGGDPKSELSELAPTSGRGAQRPELPGVDSYGNWVDAGKPKGGGKRGGKKDGLAGKMSSTQEEIASLEAEAVALLAVSVAGREYGDAVEYARKRAELLHAAQKEGKEITPELEQQIDNLAAAYAEAASSAEEARLKLQQIKDAGKAGVDAITDIFSGLLDGSKNAKEALADLLMQMAKVQLQKSVLGLAGSGGGFFGFLGGLLSVGENANGTNNWRGGLTALNERGAEIVNLPKGTQVIPHEISKRMADRSAERNGGGRLSIGFDQSTGNLTATMYNIAGKVVDQRQSGIVGQSVRASSTLSRRGSKSAFGVR